MPDSLTGITQADIGGTLTAPSSAGQTPQSSAGGFTAAAGGGDPNTITDPTGGAPNFNILNAFEEFGYYPTQAEIDALAPSFEGRTNTGEIGNNAVAQYVNYQQQLATFKANDPLTALTTQLNDAITLQTNQVNGLYNQLQTTLTSAPQLFGSLTPDQVNTYLQPLQTAFQSQLATVQGTIASRGLAGSSTENNALAQTGQQFQQNVLSTGLSIGQQQQQASATAIQNQINSLFGLTGTETGVLGQAAGQQSQQDLAQSQLVGSLPSFLNAQSAAETAQAKAASGSGAQGLFNTVTGDIGKATSAFENLLMVPQQFQAAPGANTATTSTAAGQPGAVNTAGSTLLPPSLSLTGNTASENQFLTTGSAFGS
jgi:hypothetical protein